MIVLKPMPPAILASLAAHFNRPDYRPGDHLLHYWMVPAGPVTCLDYLVTLCRTWPEFFLAWKLGHRN